VTPKQVESLREGLRRNVRMGCELDTAQTTADALLALLRRDWAVRVLDAAVAHVARDCGMWRLFTPTRVEWLREHAATPDVARHAAALAVWPKLTHGQCQEIGPCP
jgi:hypothetical protein